MIDFGPVRTGQRELLELGLGLTPTALAEASRAMTSHLVNLLSDAVDEDVTFVPEDPAAEDSFAADAAETGLAWTLGHVIGHLTASAEEAAFLAAELARGVAPHGRSRYEVPWPTISAIEASRHRLRESERMILATLGSWPDEPHLEVVYTTSGGSVRNAPARFLGGLMHADSHLGQVSEILRQARSARKGGPDQH
jgi:hypothetical protein